MEYIVIITIGLFLTAAAVAEIFYCRQRVRRLERQLLRADQAHTDTLQAFTRFQERLRKVLEDK